MPYRVVGLVVGPKGQTIKQIAKDTDRDRFMDAEEAKSYGLIDDVLEHRADSTKGS